MPLFGKSAASATGPATIVDLLPAEYGLVLIVAGLLVFEGLVLGSMVMGVRKQVFTSKEFEAGAKVRERAWGGGGVRYVCQSEGRFACLAWPGETTPDAIDSLLPTPDPFRTCWTSTRRPSPTRPSPSGTFVFVRP